MEEIDIFDDRSDTVSAGSSSREAAAPHQTDGGDGRAPGGGTKRSKFQIKPVYLLFAGILATAVWVLYPMVMPAPAPSASPRVAVIATTRQITSEAAPSSPKTPTLDGGEDHYTDDLTTSPRQKNTASGHVAVGDLPTKAQLDALLLLVQQQTTQTQAYQQAIMQSLAEVKVGLQDVKATSVSAASRGPAPARTAATAIARNHPSKSAPAPSKQVSQRPQAQGLRLNTVYPGQAWIDAKDGTHIVQVGDSIDGARIVSIDAAQRRVVTTQGEIR